MITTIEASTEIILQVCGTCPSRQKCDVYKKEKASRKCPYEYQIYLRRMNDYINNKGVDPEKYYEQLNDLCVLHIKLWRRNFFESLFGVEIAGGAKISAEANKLENTIIKKEKALGTDRATTTKKYPLADLNEEGGQKINITNIFNKISLIATNKIQIENKKVAKDLAEKKRLIIGQCTKRASPKEIVFEDLKFGEFGFQEVKPIPVKEQNKLPEPEIDPDKYPLTVTDTEEERYIPKRE